MPRFEVLVTCRKPCVKEYTAHFDVLAEDERAAELAARNLAQSALDKTIDPIDADLVEWNEEYSFQGGIEAEIIDVSVESETES